MSRQTIEIPEDVTYEQALEWLLHGEVEKWNAFRKKRKSLYIERPYFLNDPFFTCKNSQGRVVIRHDFSGANLSGESFHNMDLDDCSFTGANLTGTKFSGSSLNKADFSGAKLEGADFGKSSLTGARFIRANLTGADFTGAILSDADFAMANLSDAKLPEGHNAFQTLVKNAEEASRNARGILYFMGALCIFILLTGATTQDVQLLLPDQRMLLPIFGVKMDVKWFYYNGMIATLFIFFYFHLYLDHLIRLVADLPAVFPDRLSLSKKLYPWIFNDMFHYVRKTHGESHRSFKRIMESILDLSCWKYWAVSFVGWYFVPFTMVDAWIRFLPCRQLSLIEALMALVVLVFCFSFIFALRCKSILLKQPQKLTLLRGTLSFIIVLAIGFIYYMSQYMGKYARTYCYETNAFHKLAHPVCFGVPMITDQNLSTKMVEPKCEPTTEDPSRCIVLDETIQSWVGLRLYDIDLSGVVFGNCQLQNAYLRGARLEGASLAQSHLEGANLAWANLKNTDFRGAHMQGANLSKTNVAGSYFQNANLNTARLVEAWLGSVNFANASLKNSDLTKAYLGATNFWQANLSGANLSGADLTGAVIKNTNFKHAKYTKDHPTLPDTVFPPGFDPVAEGMELVTK